MTPIAIDGQLELFADGIMAAELRDGASLRLHPPIPREIVLRTDRPWEGNACGYMSFFRDTDRIRLYYKTCNLGIRENTNRAGEDNDGLFWSHPEYVAYAESYDGSHFTRPDLGLIEYRNWNGTAIHEPKKNNLILESTQDKAFRPHGFSVFLDTNPTTPPAERYKAVAAQPNCGPEGGQLFALTSADGIHWHLRQAPIITGFAFDSQNLAFWDKTHQCYRAYLRAYRSGEGRIIMTATSPDFQTWTQPQQINLPGAIKHELYTNQVMPYPRAPHILLGFPTRYVERQWCRGMEILPDVDIRRRRANIRERYGTAITEGLFMAGRDGKTFHLWDEAFLRPGPQTSKSWAYGDQYQGWGLLETPAALEDAPNELSFYASESYFLDQNGLFRRYSLRLDGFVSVNAPLTGGTVTTPPLTFNGAHLQLNISTSAAGSARVALEYPDGTAVPGYGLTDCHEIFGDMIQYPVAWKEKSDCAPLINRPVRLRFELHDADLYAFRFAASR